MKPPAPIVHIGPLGKWYPGIPPPDRPGDPDMRAHPLLVCLGCGSERYRTRFFYPGRLPHQMRCPGCRVVRRVVERGRR